jgi:EmrB/QacA subfamily drug resistance transporter
MKSPSEAAANIAASAAGLAAARSKPWILVATILASSMAFIDSTVVNVALPALQRSFGATVTDLQWVVEAYLLLLGSLILVGGSLGDAFGRRRMFLFGVCVFAAASAWCGGAASIDQLIAARAVQGFGAAFLVPGSLSIIGASFEDNERGRAIGTWSGFTAITAVIGPVLGGWLIEHASWRWAFLLNLPLAIAVIVVSIWRVPESRAESVHGPVDWRGALLATLGLGGVVFGLVESSQLTWTDARVISAVVLGAVCFVLFWFVEKAAKAPMVPPELFKSRDFTGANILTFLVYAALGVFLFLFPMDLIEVRHYSATAAGAAFVPMILLMFSLSRWSGGLADRYGPRPAAHHRPVNCDRRISNLGVAVCRPKLLDQLFSWDCRAWIRARGERGAADDGDHGSRGSGQLRRGFRNQQRGRAYRGTHCDCRSRNRCDIRIQQRAATAPRAHSHRGSD